MGPGGDIATLEAAIVCFGLAFALSLVALIFKKPDGKWLAPAWRMKQNYDPPGVALYVISLVLLLLGLVLTLTART